MTLHEALVVVKGQTIPALRGSGGDGHADALAVVVAGLETLETSEALYQQEKLEHKQTRRDLDAKDHEVARLKADLAHERGTLNEVAKAARYFDAPAGRLPPLAEHVAGLVAEVDRLRDKAIRFDLDRAGIESRERDAVELVERRAEVERLRAELKRALASMDRCDLAQHRHHEQLLGETSKAKAEVARLRAERDRLTAALYEERTRLLKILVPGKDESLYAAAERCAQGRDAAEATTDHCAKNLERAETRLAQVLDDVKHEADMLEGFGVSRSPQVQSFLRTTIERLRALAAAQPVERRCALHGPLASDGKCDVCEGGIWEGSVPAISPAEEET